MSVEIKEVTMEAVFVFILISAMYNLGAPLTTSNCPPGPDRDTYLQVHGDFCYQFMTFKRYTHSEAKGDCEIKGGSLVLIKNSATQDYVYKELTTTYRDTYDKVWIGLNDLVHEDHYLWEDGTSLGYSNWYQGEGPGSTTAAHNFTHITKDCVVMDTSLSVGGKWRESSCESSSAVLILSARETHPYVCQFDIIPPVTTTRVTPAVV